MDRHVPTVESSLQNMNNCVTKYLVALKREMQVQACVHGHDVRSQLRHHGAPVSVTWAADGK